MLQENLFNAVESESPTLSRQVSRANRFQLQEAVKVMVTSVICGQKSPASFAILSRDSLWEKTSEDCSLFPMELFSEPFSGTWPVWGTALDGVAGELTKPRDIPTDAIECSSLVSWPTPQAWDAKNYHDGNPQPVITPEQQKARGGGCFNLAEHAATWANPSPLQTGGTSLAGAVENWPTPNTQNGNGIGEHGDGGDNLQTTAAMWTTPRAGKTTSACDDQGTHGGGQGRSLRTDVANWHTPRGMDGREKGAAGGKMESIGTQASNWPTPNANEDKYRLQGDSQQSNGLAATSMTFRLDQETSEHGANCLSENPISPPRSLPKPRLNWEFVRALMGFPEGWL